MGGAEHSRGRRELGRTWGRLLLTSHWLGKESKPWGLPASGFLSPAGSRRAAHWFAWGEVLSCCGTLSLSSLLSPPLLFSPSSVDQPPSPGTSVQEFGFREAASIPISAAGW